MIPAFVRRREQTTGLTLVAEPTQRSFEPEAVGAALRTLGASVADRLPDPIRYSDFLGGRGRPVFPAGQDVVFTINPATGLGGMGASWEFETFGVKQPMPAPALGAEYGKAGALNAPIAGYPGMVAWPERANEYRPPYQPLSSVIDQRTGAVNPWANPR